MLLRDGVKGIKVNALFSEIHGGEGSLNQLVIYIHGKGGTA